MSDCCGDYYVEAHIKGIPLKTVKETMTAKGLYDPKSENDVLQKEDGELRFVSYSPGHDQYIKDAFQLQEDVEGALKDLADARGRGTYDARLHIYKYEWIEI
jgi:hypothetical protein